MEQFKRYIFKRGLGQKYVSDYNKYIIDIVYGDNILIGDDIEEEYKDK